MVVATVTPRSGAVDDTPELSASATSVGTRNSQSRRGSKREDRSNGKGCMSLNGYRTKGTIVGMPICLLVHKMKSPPPHAPPPRYWSSIMSWCNYSKTVEQWRLDPWSTLNREAVFQMTGVRITLGPAPKCLTSLPSFHLLLWDPHKGNF